MDTTPVTTPEEGVPAMAWDQFLIFLTHLGATGPDDPLVWMVLEELGLADKRAFTQAEMLAIEHGLGIVIQSGLESSKDPQVQAYAKLMATANAMFTRHAKDAF